MKRKLTRKSLDELSKVMPVLNEDEQRVCIGGNFYYTEDGRFLGSVGPGSEIRVIDSGSFYQQPPGDCGDYSYYEEKSTPLSGSSFDSKLLVLNEIASGLGIPVVNFYSGPSNELAQCNSGGFISVNINSQSFSSGNYFDFLLTLKHEKQHSDTLDDAGTAYSEYEAYKVIVESSYFKLTSPSFQESMINQYNEYKKKAGIK